MATNIATNTPKVEKLDVLEEDDEFEEFDDGTTATSPRCSLAMLPI